MSKKLFAAIVSLLISLAGYAAQLTATLQSGETVKPFYGADALKDALSAATNGDVITLSTGVFKSPGTIAKEVTIIGTYAFSNDASKSSYIDNYLTITANNVTLEAIRHIYTLTIKGADNLTIERCYLPTIADNENEEHKYHDNTTIIDTRINKFDAMSLSKNCVLRNCTVNFFNDCNESSNPALIENCNVAEFREWDSSGTYHYTQPYAIYRNCLLGLYSQGFSSTSPALSFYSPSEFHNCAFLESFYYNSTSNFSKSWTISFNSCNTSNNLIAYKYSVSAISALTGYDSFTLYTYNSKSYGPDNHKEYPAIPAITSSTIDTKTDADGNLHVKIVAKARD